MAVASFVNVSDVSASTVFMLSNMHEGFWKVLTKIWNFKMSTVEFTRPSKSALEALIKREDARVGSLTQAYENVGRLIGMSSSWIRKYLADDKAIQEPRLKVYVKIAAAYYDRVCSRVEEEHHKERMEIAKLQEELDAINKSILELAALPSATQDVATRTRSSEAAPELADQA